MRLKAAIAPAGVAKHYAKQLKYPFCCWRRQSASLVVIAQILGVIPSQDGIHFEALPCLSLRRKPQSILKLRS
jgi:hypothetical protein